jgi:hypothetical protein
MNRQTVSVERLEKMGNAMRARTETTKDSLSEPSPQYIFVPSEHFAIVKRKDGDRVVYIVSSPAMTNGKKDVSFCHEIMDPAFAHHAYPLMGKQLKQDLGTLRDFLSADRFRLDRYNLLAKVPVPGGLDDLTSVRAVLWGEQNKAPITPEGAKLSLKAVTQDFKPSFDFKLNAGERAHLNARQAVAPN